MHRAEALINKIIPFSAVDGPGNRTAIFTQGCNFTCAYCHNPETISVCAGCGACVEKCPASALVRIEDAVNWDKTLCQECDCCIRACARNSSPRVRLMTADDVMSEIDGYLPFISGITVSGGECTLWRDFVTELFQAVKRRQKTAFADSNGFIDFSSMPELLAVMDMAMIDLKAANPDEHRKLTGRDNGTVIQNIAHLASIGKLYEIRTVVVPDFLDNVATIELGSQLIAKYPEVRYKLIRYRPVGARVVFESPSDDWMETLAARALDMGVKNVVVV